MEFYVATFLCISADSRCVACKLAICNISRCFAGKCRRMQNPAVCVVKKVTYELLVAAQSMHSSLLEACLLQW